MRARRLHAILEMREEAVPTCRDDEGMGLNHCCGVGVASPRRRERRVDKQSDIGKNRQIEIRLKASLDRRAGSIEAGR